MLICVFSENVKKSVVCQGNRVMSLFNRISCFDNEFGGQLKPPPYQPTLLFLIKHCYEGLT